MELETYLKALDNRTEIMVNRIIQWVNINTHTFNVTGLERMASVLTQAFYEFVKEVGRELDQDITWKPSGGCSDGNNLADAGLPNIDSLGICGGKIHSTREFLQVDCLVPRTKLTAAILMRLSEGKF